MVESNHRHGFLFSNDPFTPNVGLSPPSSAILFSLCAGIRYRNIIPQHIFNIYTSCTIAVSCMSDLNQLEAVYSRLCCHYINASCRSRYRAVPPTPDLYRYTTHLRTCCRGLVSVLLPCLCACVPNPPRNFTRYD